MVLTFQHRRHSGTEGSGCFLLLETLTSLGLTVYMSLQFYTCIHIYIYMYIHVNKKIYIYMYVYIYIYCKCIYIYITVNIYIYTYIYMFHSQAYKQTSKQASKQAHKPASKHTYIHAEIVHPSVRNHAYPAPVNPASQQPQAQYPIPVPLYTELETNTPEQP